MTKKTEILEEKMRNNTYKFDEKYEDEKVLYSFKTPEYIEEQRGQVWYVGMGIGIILGVLIGIFQESLSLILVSITIGAIYTLTHNKKPKMVEVKFTESGMIWRNTFYLYQEIEKFWILWKPGERKTLHIWLSKKVSKEIVIPIHMQKISDIRDVLGYYVPEIEGRKEPLSDLLSRKLKL